MLSIRKIGVVSRTYRHLNRYRHILAVLLKHGFGELVESLRIDQYLEVGLQMISKKRPPREEPLTRPQRVRMALEEFAWFDRLADDEFTPRLRETLPWAIMLDPTARR
jgi:ubiquinone biosynthesis protein